MSQTEHHAGYRRELLWVLGPVLACVFVSYVEHQQDRDSSRSCTYPESEMVTQDTLSPDGVLRAELTCMDGKVTILIFDEASGNFVVGIPTDQVKSDRVNVSWTTDSNFLTMEVGSRAAAVEIIRRD